MQTLQELLFLEKLEKRQKEQNYRSLIIKDSLLKDFASNDYLGFARDQKFKRSIINYWQSHLTGFGATGSRLLTGNSLLFEELEKSIASFHKAKAALLFNSGYNANIAFNFHPTSFSPKQFTSMTPTYTPQPMQACI